MVHRLVFLGVVAPPGLGGMQVGHALAAVFGVAQAALGEHLVEEADPPVVQEQARHIPAQIQVPGHDVRQVSHPVKGAAHGVTGKAGGAGGVHLVAQLVELAVVVQHVLFIFGGDGDLVGQAPGDNAGVVVVLHDQLFHLADGVLPPGGHVLGDVGDLRPDDHAVFVAQIVEVLVVLVVGQPDGVGADLPDQGHILLVVGAAQRVADSLAVLMAGNAVQRITPPVEEETLLRVHAEGAHTEPAADLVHHRAVFHKADRRPVEVGVGHAVPQVHVRNAQGHVRAFAPGHLAAFGVGEDHLHLRAGRVVPAFHPHLAVGARHAGGHLQAGAAEVVHGEAVLVHHHQFHVPVNAAVEGEVRLLGIDPVVHAVVHLHHQVILLRQQSGDAAPEGGVTAVVVQHRMAVQLHIGAGIHALKLQIHILRRRVESGHGEVLLIGAGAAPVVVAAILPVHSVPGVGDIHRAGVSLRAGEGPLFIQIDPCSHGRFFVPFCPAKNFTILSQCLSIIGSTPPDFNLLSPSGAKRGICGTCVSKLVRQILCKTRIKISFPHL